MALLEFEARGEDGADLRAGHGGDGRSRADGRVGTHDEAPQH